MQTEAPTIRLVVATRKSEQDFFRESALGRTLGNVHYSGRVEVRHAANNTMGLPTVYNHLIRESVDHPAILVFIHDDVHLLDYHWCYRLVEALSEFDIVGLAGNTRRMPYQPMWMQTEKQDWSVKPDKHPYRHRKWQTDKGNLSGIIGHGTQLSSIEVGQFGPPRRQVKLLDGVFLAARSDTLLKNELFFDERFLFHFYDLDFCRQAEVKGLTCGTWDIAVMHESKGSFGSQPWKEGYELYMEKWGS